jgi:dolichol-phosphate mannosyltransferase
VTSAQEYRRSAASNSREKQADSREKLALVIPALQEAGNLPEVLRRTLAALDEVPLQSEVIVVDDDSRDGTVEIVRAMAVLDPRVRLLVRQGERGLAGAVLHGWRQSDGTLLAVMDADLQHPPELLPQLLGAMLCGADVAVASRYKTGGSTGQWNAARRFVSSSATWLTKPLLPSKLRVKDPMSGFFVIRRECVEGLRLQTTGFKLLLELLVRGRIGQVSEVSFSFGVRHAGRSKASLQVAREYGRLLLRLYRERGAMIPMAPMGLPVGFEPVAEREFLVSNKAEPEAELAVREIGSLVLQ